MALRIPKPWETHGSNGANGSIGLARVNVDASATPLSNSVKTQIPRSMTVNQSNAALADPKTLSTSVLTPAQAPSASAQAPALTSVQVPTSASASSQAPTSAPVTSQEMASRPALAPVDSVPPSLPQKLNDLAPQLSFGNGGSALQQQQQPPFMPFGSMPYSTYPRFGEPSFGGPSMPYYSMNDPRRLGLVGSTALQTVESVVAAFGGFAQMLESTFYATNSSFYAIMSLTDHFRDLKNHFASILSAFAVMRWIRQLLNFLSGKHTPPIDPREFITMQEQPAAILSSASTATDINRRNRRSSYKPLLLFAIALIGLPYIMTKFIKSMYMKELAASGLPPGELPSKLEFCQAKFNFKPQEPNVELELKVGDLVVVLSKTDIHGRDSLWWYGRTKDGRSGWFPSNYCAVLEI